MPTPVVDASKMSVGAAGRGKHWTKAQVESRAAANEQATRQKRVTMRPPDWLKENEPAMKVWDSIIRKLKGIELLDNLDTELLAIYCDSLVQYRHLTWVWSHPGKIQDDGEKPQPMDDLLKAVQAQARIVKMYAEMLGLTPGGRARLAKKKAEKVDDPFADSFGG